MNTVSLIIPTYNREEDLVKCLECAFAQIYSNLEIIVIDQTKQHKPETQSFLEKNANRFQWVKPNFASVSKARNEGVRISKGEIIVMIDDDTSFDINFIGNHVAMHEKFDVVQGRVIEEGSKNHPHPTWISPMIKFKGGDNCLYEGPTNSVTGCNFSFKRKVYETIGAFDERFQGVAVREDSEFGYRAFKSGFKMIYSPTAQLFHHRAMTGGVETGLEREYFFKPTYYRSELLFAKKHFSGIAVFNYRIRLFLRGAKQLLKLIKVAEKEVDTYLN